MTTPERRQFPQKQQRVLTHEQLMEELERVKRGDVGEAGAPRSAQWWDTLIGRAKDSLAAYPSHPPRGPEPQAIDPTWTKEQLAIHDAVLRVMHAYGELEEKRGEDAGTKQRSAT
jgi:hypothetical protein